MTQGSKPVTKKNPYNLANLAGVVVFWIGLSTALLIARPAHAQIDAFTFFIPYPRDILDDQFDIGYAPLSLINDDIDTTISIAIHRGNAVIYYDHWEDGLESDLTRPIQPTSQIWGDNDPSNGLPPGFTTDTLNPGDVIVLRNTVILPQDPNEFFFDGGDVFTSVGGAVAATLSVWPIHSPAPPEIGILYAGAWELYPTNSWGLIYHIPVGENLSGTRPGFTVVGVNVQAAQDATQVELDLDASGDFETVVVLNRGEQFTQISGVTVGARVQASAPVQVHVFTANPNESYEARAYTITPFDQWTSDLLAPRSSDGDFWLYNPHPAPLTVTVQTLTTTTAITIPAVSTAKYPPAGLSSATGVYFVANDGRPFYGIAALDASEDQDWGYALQPIDRQMTQTFVGQGRGNNNNPPDNDESRIYVTALVTTTIFVDYNNDGTADNNFAVLPLQEVPITDPDHDLTGAYLYTQNGVRFAAAWGQDQTANRDLPSIDVGTTLIPLPSLLIQKTVNPLFEDVDCTGSITLGDILQYRLQYFNNSYNPISNVIVEDTLPPEVSYIPNSTILNGLPAPDASTGSPFLFDEGGLDVGDLPMLASRAIQFSVVADQPTAAIVNLAQVRSTGIPLGSDSAIVTTPAITATEPIYRLDARLVEPASGIATAGEPVTFSVTITNTGGITITQFPLDHEYDSLYLTFQSANPTPDSVTANLITWNDLTSLFGPLAPNQTVSLTTSFTVNPLTAPVTTTNVAIGLGGRLISGPSLGICRDEAKLNLVLVPTTPTPTSTTTTPTPSSTPIGTPTGSETPVPGPSVSPTLTPPATGTPGISPTPTADDDDDDDGGSTPPAPNTPPPGSPGTATPGAGTPGASLPPGSSPPGATPTMPVTLLPETGQRDSVLPALWGIALLAGVGVWVIWRWSTRDDN